jgi:hypothetical protein
MARCPVCGIDESTISVRDAMASVRTFPRRFREALDGLPPDKLREKPDDSESMLDLAARAAATFSRLAAVLPDALDHLRSSLDPEAVDSVGSPSSRDAVLSTIDQACGALLARADHAPVQAWERKFSAAGREREAGWLLQHAAHEGAHELREIARVRREVTGGD